MGTAAQDRVAQALPRPAQRIQVAGAVVLVLLVHVDTSPSCSGSVVSFLDMLQRPEIGSNTLSCSTYKLANTYVARCSRWLHAAACLYSCLTQLHDQGMDAPCSMLQKLSSPHASLQPGSAAACRCLCLRPHALAFTAPLSTRKGTSAASQGASPRHSACAIPKCGEFLAHSGLKCIVRQILPPRYILAVLPSSSGSSISGAVAGYVAGMSNCGGQGREGRRSA